MVSPTQKARKMQERKIRITEERKAMAESALGYKERKRREAEDRATARRCLDALDAMSEEELQVFYIRLGASGYGADDLIRFRLEHIATKEIQPVPDVDEEDILEVIPND